MSLFIGRENEPLEVALLIELVQTVAHCDRILSNRSCRSLVMAGRSGVGRHTCVKILSVLHKARLLTSYPGKNYGQKQFISDLKIVIENTVPSIPFSFLKFVFYN